MLLKIILYLFLGEKEKEKESKKSLAYSSISEQMIRPLDRSKIRLNVSLKKDEKDIKVFYFISH